MNQQVNVNDALAAIRKAVQNPLPDAIQRAWLQSGSATTGITMYDLEAGAKLLFPVITPLRNTLPRVGGGTGTATNWRAVTGINTANMQVGVGQGQRSGILAHTTSDNTAPYAGIGVEDYVTFEAQYAAAGFDNVQALAMNTSLSSLMMQEEPLLLAGNRSLALGITPTPTATGSTTGGSLPAATYSVICVALTLAGVASSSVVGGVVGQITRANADGTSLIYGGGSARRSAAAAATVASGSAGKITCSVTPVNGAFAYAWFWGAATAETLGAITTINSYVILDDADGTQLASAIVNGGSDNSTNAYVFDGAITQLEASGSGAYVATLATGTPGTGTPLQASGDAGIVQIDDALLYLWETSRLSPDVIWVSSQQSRNITTAIMAAGANAAQRFVFNVDQSGIRGGSMVTSYLNKFGVSGGGAYGNGKEIPIQIHPNLPAGTIWLQTKTLPYALANVPNVMQVKTRQDYYALQWPLVTRKYEYGVYADELLQCYAPFSMGVIRNIAPGVAAAP